MNLNEICFLGLRSKEKYQSVSNEVEIVYAVSVSLVRKQIDYTCALRRPLKHSRSI